MTPHTTESDTERRTSRAARTYEAFHRLSRDFVLAFDADGTVIYASPALQGLLHLDVQDLVAHDLTELLHPQDRDVLQSDFVSVLASGAPRASTVRLRAGDGSYRWMQTATANLLDASIGGVVCTMTDVTEQLVAERALRAAEARCRAIFDAAEEGIWAISSTCETLYVNRRMGEILGAGDGSAYDFNSLESLDPRAASEIRRRLATREQRGPERYEISYKHPDGRTRQLWISAAPLPGPDGKPVGSLAMVSDITDVRTAEHELRAAALRDALTSLPNRALLVDRLSQALARASGETAVLFVDLDDFKLVNDSQGHDTGDQLLIAVAQRIRALAGPHDTVARFGSDEFVIVCENTDATRACAVGERILASLREPIDLPTGQVHSSGSIGVATAQPGATGAGDLLRYADTAMHSAKAGGRGRVHLFDPIAAAGIEDDYALAGQLRTALAAADPAAAGLTVHYQPIISLGSGALIGLEALTRWHHPTRGAIAPATFVTVAERAGLAAQLDRWVIQRALSDMRGLRTRQAVHDRTILSINVSASSLSDSALGSDLQRWAAAADVPPQNVSLEITETAIMQDASAGLAMLGALRQQGFRVAIDDFGTGYSSLAYLRDLPITTLKIDRSFVTDITSKREALAIVGSILELSRAVAVDVIAEGVETREQAHVLRELGCSYGQGWWWSRAVPPEEVSASQWDVTAPMPVEERRQRRTRTAMGVEHGLIRLLELHSAGASHTTIAAALNAEGFRTPSGQRWHTRSVGMAVMDASYPSLVRHR